MGTEMSDCKRCEMLEKVVRTTIQYMDGNMVKFSKTYRTLNDVLEQPADAANTVKPQEWPEDTDKYLHLPRKELVQLLTTLRALANSGSLEMSLIDEAFLKLGLAPWLTDGRPKLE